MSNPADREQNKQKVQQAEQIAVARAAELEATGYNMVTDAGRKTIITTWMQAYVATYTKKDKRNMQGALNRFISFLATPEQKKTGLTFGNLTALIIEEFQEYLESKSKGEGALSYYNRFKKMIKQAYKKRLLKENILELVERKAKGKAKKRDILLLEEITRLAATPITNLEIRRAFLFTCLAGRRWIEVKNLIWGQIDLKTKSLQLTQSKTDVDAYVPLNDSAIKLLGAAGEKNALVFDLPTANGANKTVKAWLKRAGIEKKITWHNGRHSFGTNLIIADTDILTASKLLGHTSTKHTHRYVDSVREMKERATDKLNIDL